MPRLTQLGGAVVEEQWWERGGGRMVGGERRRMGGVSVGSSVDKKGRSTEQQRRVRQNFR